MTDQILRLLKEDYHGAVSMLVSAQRQVNPALPDCIRMRRAQETASDIFCKTYGKRFGLTVVCKVLYPETDETRELNTLYGG